MTTVHSAGLGRDGRGVGVELVVLDGARLGGGPVWSLLLPHTLPYPRSLQFIPKYLGPARTAPASWKPTASVATSSSLTGGAVRAQERAPWSGSAIKIRVNKGREEEVTFKFKP